MKRRYGESGQALTELVVMLLAISAMILALVVLADVQFVGNSLVLDARFKAQHLSRSADVNMTESGDEYRSWGNSTISLGNSSKNDAQQKNQPIFRSKGRNYYYSAAKDGNGRRISSVSIPFAVGASASRNPEESTISPAYSGLAGEGYSDNNGDWENFRTWRTLSNFSGAAYDADFSGTVSSQNALNTASLVRATGSVEGRLLTIRQAGSFSAGDALSRMKRAFALLLGGNPDKFSPPDDPSNQAVMPRIVR